jgi:hypothetical protein
VVEEIRVKGGTVIVGEPDGQEAFVAARAAQLGRQCGSCSLCCKVLVIPELSKPAGPWCEHCNPGRGCSIYADRPPVCRAFGCQWLLDASFGDEWLPTRSKMVLRMLPNEHTGGLALHVYVDRDYPNAWRKSPYHKQLKDRSTRILVGIHIGKRRVLVRPDRDIEFSEGEVVLGMPADRTEAKLGTVKAFKQLLRTASSSM